MAADLERGADVGPCSPAVTELDPVAITCEADGSFRRVTDGNGYPVAAFVSPRWS